MSATNEVATNFEVVKHQGKYLCVLTYGGRRYCFKYAYDKEEVAFHVIHKFQYEEKRDFTWIVDLNTNYWRYEPRFNYTFSLWQDGPQWFINNGIFPNL